MGFLNPTLYSAAKASGYGAAFHDITTGNNTNALSPSSFFAVPGYDLCTGWGTPTGLVLINALSGTAMAPAVPVQIRMAVVGDLISLSWTGDNPPYQVQVTSNLSDTNWTILASTTNLSLTTVEVTNIAAFYRVLGH